ncbi:hypothetical protein HHK36_007653 [Tetracentron sinense]|uniref:Uncharacterized protein n=1 Tax=Tetracentron sinense TaxID=13715 RepID=A0A835DQB7_TETSI|nr:hypothetical protein HHK36_007631 [Tetracentron sinense]KAF8408497.1 hypothetical protein HHK36_007653 [Tetracentron sinense]
MATVTVIFVILFMAIFFANLHTLVSTNAHTTISASPAILPTLTPPDISSSPSTQLLPNSVALPNLVAFAPVPSSGEFVGKSSSSSVKLAKGTSISCIWPLFVILRIESQGQDLQCSQLRGSLLWAFGLQVATMQPS